MNNCVIDSLLGLSSATPGRNQLTGLSIGTAETILSMGTDTSGTTAAAFLGVPSQTTIAGAGNPRNVNANMAGLYPNPSSQVAVRGLSTPRFNSSSFDGRALKIRLQGNYTTGTSTATATVKLYQNTTAALAGGNSLVGSAMISTTHAATAGNFIVECIVQWDSVSTTLNAVESWGSFGGTYVARGNQSITPITVTAANWAKSLFVASVTFSANSSGNLFNPTEFTLEEV